MVTSYKLVMFFVLLQIGLVSSLAQKIFNLFRFGQLHLEQPSVLHS